MQTNPFYNERTRIYRKRNCSIGKFFHPRTRSTFTGPTNKSGYSICISKYSLDFPFGMDHPFMVHFGCRYFQRIIFNDG